MAVLDIRELPSDPVTSIIFASGSQIEQHSVQSLGIQDCDGDYISVSYKDIDNLIKALQKAKELWSKP